MPWISKKAECDWCSEEMNGMCDSVYESEKGVLCEKCEKARLQEKIMYPQLKTTSQLKMDRAIDKVSKQLTSDQAEEAAVSEAAVVAEFCDTCGQELPDGDDDGSNETTIV